MSNCYNENLELTHHEIQKKNLHIPSSINQMVIL